LRPYRILFPDRRPESRRCFSFRPRHLEKRNRHVLTPPPWNREIAKREAPRQGYACTPTPLYVLQFKCRPTASQQANGRQPAQRHPCPVISPTDGVAGLQSRQPRRNAGLFRPPRRMGRTRAPGVNFNPEIFWVAGAMAGRWPSLQTPPVPSMKHTRSVTSLLTEAFPRWKRPFRWKRAADRNRFRKDFRKFKAKICEPVDRRFTGGRTTVLAFFCWRIDPMG